MSNNPKFPSLVGFATNSAKDGEKVGFIFQLNCTDQFDEIGRMSILQSLLDDLVYPEVMLQIKEGKLDLPFNLRKAHLLLYSDESRNEILLNNKVRIKGLVKFQDGRSVKIGEIVNEENIQEILGLYPDEKNDPNAAHIMMIKVQRKWYFAFDLIYDRERIRKRFEGSRKFMITAEHCQKENLWGPFADNLFSATELAIQSILLLHHNPKFSLNQSHEDTHELVKAHADNGNIDTEFVKNYEKLFELRKKGRYLTGVHAKDFTLSDLDAKQYYDTTKRLIEYTEKFFERINFSRKVPNGDYLSFGIGS